MRSEDRVTGNGTAFQRARSAEHKEERRRALLDAACSLALRSGVRAVTLTEIANEAGVHVSAVRRYFESREDIYLSLAAEGWREWSDAASRALLESRVTSARDLATRISRSLADRPLFCDLLAHAPLSLERDVSKAVVREFKLVAVPAVDDLVSAITQADPRISPQGAYDLVAAVSGTAATLWQISHPPATLAELYAEEPRLAHAAVDFAPRMQRLIETLVRGLVASEPAVNQES